MRESPEWVAKSKLSARQLAGFRRMILAIKCSREEMRHQAAQVEGDEGAL